MSERFEALRLQFPSLPPLESVPFAQLLGIGIREISRGYAVLSIEVRDELRQNHGVVHGGVIASIIDTASAYAVATLLDKSEVTTTIDLTVHFLEAMTGGQAEARAKILREGRRVVVISVDVVADDGRLIATATAAFLRRQPRSA
jgi:acyl-CoA thioesterase